MRSAVPCRWGASPSVAAPAHSMPSSTAAFGHDISPVADESAAMMLIWSEKSTKTFSSILLNTRILLRIFCQRELLPAARLFPPSPKTSVESPRSDAQSPPCPGFHGGEAGHASSARSRGLWRQGRFTPRNWFAGRGNPVQSNQSGEGPGNGASWERGRSARKRGPEVRRRRPAICQSGRDARAPRTRRFQAHGRRLVPAMPGQEAGLKTISMRRWKSHGEGGHRP